MYNGACLNPPTSKIVFAILSPGCNTCCCKYFRKWELPWVNTSLEKTKFWDSHYFFARDFEIVLRSYELFSREDKLSEPVIWEDLSISNWRLISKVQLLIRTESIFDNYLKTRWQYSWTSLCDLLSLLTTFSKYRKFPSQFTVNRISRKRSPFASDNLS